MAGLIEIELGQCVEVLDEVTAGLGEFVDMMPDALPKELPPCQGIDHKIKLEHGARTLAKALYKMSHLKLVDLRKQLNELLDADFVQPSKLCMVLRFCFKESKMG